MNKKCDLILKRALRRRFSVGESTTRQFSLQLVSI